MIQLSFLCELFPQRHVYFKKDRLSKSKYGQVANVTRKATTLFRVCPSVGIETSMVFASFTGRKAVGVDYGMSRVGVAVSVGFSPRPLTCIKHENNTDLVLEKLSEIVSSERAEIIVVGLPLSARVECSSGQTQKAMNFAQLVANRFSKQEVYLCDEKYTSIVANERLAERGISLVNSKELIDSEAAVVLLERFFGGWSSDKSGLYLKLVKPQHENIEQDVETLEEQENQVSPTYTPYREWRRNLLRPRH
ncbi:Putative pre-16S rRNA nuclease [Galdieria sulphuraria]|uniref:DNA binding / hydrolase n=1 Tax=Galdieria sulphuraria TaxID=130081 RepID=M2X2I9_GALSU|nr:DNA binding / hydrolase [Galdieria sulphuraria]EME30600.1 DNA binding / hydrolase [Galdieria sulphuraria]GJD08998.1 Putative pre-16S rRNA nuclease [Galdieria sulphuraria]|eukprot:XP_005707120.1 DNA binding / hydrolase [Galdieria sulphuraria]